jgi:hypothetical protein
LLGEVLRAGVRVRAVSPALRFVQRGRHLPPLEQLEEAVVWTDGRSARLVRRGEPPETRSGSGALAYLLNLGGAVQRLRSELQKTSTVTI